MSTDAPTEKRCTKCGETKPLSDFYQHIGARHGRCPDCKICHGARSKRWVQENRPRRLAYNRARYASPEHRARHMHGAARRRAQRKGLEFSITEGWVLDRVQKGKCELTGLDFVLGQSPDTMVHPFAPSIDQKRAGHGYTEENCRVVCNAANAALGEWGEEAFEQVAKAYLAEKERKCQNKS